MTLVKICGITNAEDALAAVEAGAGLLGFNFYAKSPRYVSPMDARRIVERLPEGVKGVGVLVNEDAEAVERIASEAGITTVQLHGDETPEFCSNLRGLSVIKALRVGKDFRVEDTSKFETDAVLLDAYVKNFRGGTGHTFDWSIARRTREVVLRLYLAGGLSAENVAEAVKSVRPYAVDVCSGVETAPGRKSFQLMRRFVEAVRAGEAED
ncbi:MAG TPA: phosphoribosylanthranilate isomerase [Pyrinomonadaceae bacterium]|nr:phosphoribosylanthranilate isomerase [Pyrinomonadaceae bacterium]